MSKYAVFFGLSVVGAIGCTTGGTGGGGGSGGDGGGGEGGTILPTESYTVEFPDTVVASGTENTQCVVLRLSNDHPIHVNQIQNQLNDGSHHLIVYRTNDAVEQPVPFDCQPFTDTLKPETGSPLMITQKHSELLTLPQGVAFTLAESQMVRLEMHYINATTEDLVVHATSTFYAMPDADFQNEADFLFLGDPDIQLQAMSAATLGPVFLKLPATAGLDGVNFFGITGHTHQWGTDVKVWTAANETDPGTPVYDVPDWQWAEPATVMADPPFQIPTGGGFKFSCSWNNLSSTSVGFGESANDEMCFFWAYYYPSKGAFVCAHTDQVQGGFDLCCPGNPLCSQLFP